MKRTETKKTFDCVAMKREGAARIYETVKNMTGEEEMAYWQRIDAEFQRRHEESRKKWKASRSVSRG